MRPMASPAEWRCAVADLLPGHTARLSLERAGRTVHGFVVNHDGAYFAYVNRCPHIGTPLDLWPNEFLSEDGRLLVCSTHGALFEPDGGRCIAGPCATAGHAHVALAARSCACRHGGPGRPA